MKAKDYQALRATLRQARDDQRATLTAAILARRAAGDSWRDIGAALGYSGQWCHWLVHRRTPPAAAAPVAGRVRRARATGPAYRLCVQRLGPDGDTTALNDQLTTALRAGWRLHGPLYWHGDGHGDLLLMQALIRDPLTAPPPPEA